MTSLRSNCILILSFALVASLSITNFGRVLAADGSCEIGKVTASNASGSSQYGTTIAVSGDVAVAGAPGADGLATASGAVYVLRRAAGEWTEEAILAASDGATGDEFGASVSIASDGAVVVGAPARSDSGGVYVYRYSSGSWSEEQILTASDAAAGDRFGAAVALTSGRAIVGAPQADTLAGSDSGAAYIFDYSSGTWSETQKLTGSDVGADELFGFSVDVDLDRAVVCNRANDDAAGDIAAYVFDLISGSWVESETLVASDGASTNMFGYSVALLGSLVVVGAPGDDDLASNAGSVYVYREASGVWSAETQLYASDAGAGHSYGYAVSLDGSVLVVGAPAGDGIVSGTGAVYCLSYSLGSWTEDSKLTASDGDSGDAFGAAVGVAGVAKIVGAPLDDGIGDASGSVYVFDAIGLDCNTNGVDDLCDLLDGDSLDCNDNGIPDECDISGGASADCNADGIPDECETDLVPLISENPSSQSVCAGSELVLSVVADGSGTLTYAWSKDGELLADDTAVLTISSVDSSHAGVYTVAVTDDCGSTVSADAVVAILSAPSVTGFSHGAEEHQCLGGSVTFSVTATGEDLTYQWQKDGEPISGETSASYSISTIAATDAGTFDVVVSNSCGSENSSATALIVDEETSITEQPASSTICEGDDVTLSVTATGAGTLTYQWHDGAGALTGETASTLLLSGAGSGIVGNYYVVVSGDCGDATSDIVTVDQRPDPAAGGLSSATVCAGAEASFSATASGFDPLTYQWSHDGAPIDGATGSSLLLSAVDSSDAGTYELVVTDGCGRTASTSASLTVEALTLITSQPAGATVCEGASQAFEVEATGDGSLTYQWRKDGVEIGGAVSALLTIDPVTAADAGSYDVVVTANCGSITSDSASLQVLTATAITGEPAGGTICEGDSFDLSVAAEGENLTYQWRKDGAAIDGATSTSLAIASAAASDAASYDVVITGDCGSATSAAAVLVVNEKTSISSQPVAGTVCEGASHSFEVVAAGAGTLTYQWRKDGVALAGAVSAELAIDPVSPADAGLYDVVVTGECGTATSDAVSLDVSIATAITGEPAGGTICEGDSFDLSVVAVGENLTYEWRKDGVAIDGATSASLAIASASASDAASYDVVVTGGCGSVTSAAAVLVVNAKPSIGTQPAGASVCEGASQSFEVVATGAGTLTYQWRKDGADVAGAVSASLTIDPVAAADAGRYDVVVTGECGSVTSESVSLHVFTTTTITGQPAGGTVCEGDSFDLSVTAVGESLTYQWRKDSAAIDGATSSTLSIAIAAASDAASYDVVVAGDCGSATSDAAVLVVNADTTISSQPAGASICGGESHSFAVVAAGGGTITYQWRKDGADLPGATSSTLSIDPAGSSDAGLYDVVVTSSCGSVTSAGASLEIRASTAITGEPAGGTICEGDSHSFTVVATGGDLSYQWRKNGAAISGATSATLSITDAAASAAASYDVVVTGDCGSATSAAAVLVVNADTAVTSQPVGGSICDGGSHSFEVAAVGGGTLTYQWRKDGANLSGENSAILTIEPAASTDAGLYDVVVTSSCGSATSDVVSLEIVPATAITGAPAGATVCEGDSHEFSVAAAGENITYQWRKSGAAIAGATSSTFSIASAAASDAASYDVVVTGDCASVTSAAAVLVVEADTAISAQPASTSACDGGAAVFEVSASGSGVLAYQWRKNGVDISGATASSYEIDPASTADAAAYDVVVTGACGSITSAAASLSIVSLTAISSQPAGASVCDGDSHTFTCLASGSGLSFQWRKGGIEISGANSSSFTVDTAGPADAGSYDVVVTAECGTVTSDTASLAILTTTAITGEPAGGAVCEDESFDLSVVAVGENLTYQWRKNGAAIKGATSSSFSIASAAASDAASYDVVVTGGCGSSTSAAAVLGVNSAPTISAQPGGTSACVGGEALFEVAASGAGVLAYQWRKDGAAISGATSSSYLIDPVSATDAAEYDVVVTGECGSVTSVAANLSVVSATGITSQPEDASVCDGDSHTFTASASGSGLSYQWRKDGVAINGATESSYTIDFAGAIDAGSYDVVVSGDCGSLASDAAQLAVTEQTSITAQPVGGTPCEGDDFTLQIFAAGTGPLGYEWRRNGEVISGATGSSYSIAEAATSDTAFYECEVSGPCGSALSDLVVVEVMERPRALAGPDSTHVCKGDLATLSVVASGAGLLTYQWQRDGADLDGETASSITVHATSDQPEVAEYTVMITGTCGSTVSPVATVEVVTPVSIVSDPVGASACEGGVIKLEVAVDGTEPISYEWSLNGEVVEGATGAGLTLDPLEAADAGYYTVVVTNECGEASSDAAAVTLNDADTCGQSIVRGDGNDDGKVDLADVVTTIQFLFGGEPTGCVLSHDANDDNRANIADPIWEISWLFRDGPQMPRPYPSCGADPTPGLLTCETYTGCD